MSRDNLINPSEPPTAPGFVRRLFDALEGVLNGRSRNQGSVTLAANVTTTVVDNPLFESHQTPVFVPLTANAAAEIGAGGLYVSARTRGQFTITHANAATTDRTFEYVFVG
jgi:hypothetical protein